MRGLPFPQDAAFERETSYEYGTPASNFDEIPIDPALADPPIDPALQLYSIKIDPDQVQVRVRLYPQHATRLLGCGCGAPRPIDRVASRPFLTERSAYSHAHIYLSFRPSFLCLFPLMLPIIFASTRRVPRVIPLLNPHRQNTFPLSVRPFLLPSHKKGKGRYAGSQIVASVAGTTRRIRLANRRKWCLVTSVVVVVGFYSDYTWGFC